MLWAIFRLIMAGPATGALVEIPLCKMMKSTFADRKIFAITKLLFPFFENYLFSPIFVGAIYLLGMNNDGNQGQMVSSDNTLPPTVDTSRPAIRNATARFMVYSSLHGALASGE